MEYRSFSRPATNQFQTRGCVWRTLNSQEVFFCPLARLESRVWRKPFCFLSTSAPIPTQWRHWRSPLPLKPLLLGWISTVSTKAFLPTHRRAFALWPLWNRLQLGRTRRSIHTNVASPPRKAKNWTMFHRKPEATSATVSKWAAKQKRVAAWVTGSSAWTWCRANRRAIWWTRPSFTRPGVRVWYTVVAQLGTRVIWVMTQNCRWWTIRLLQTRINTKKCQCKQMLILTGIFQSFDAPKSSNISLVGRVGMLLREGVIIKFFTVI